MKKSFFAFFQIGRYTGLLIHLSQEQMKKTGAKVVEGEDLDILVGNYPL